MRWKERIRPSNTSEATFYKAILMIVLLVAFGFTLEIVLPFLRWVYSAALILSIAYPIWQGVRLNYEVSFGKSLWFSTLLTFMLVLALVALYFCFGLIIATIRPLLPNQLTKIVEVILFIVLITGLSFKSKNLVSFLRHSLLERTFGLVPKISTKDYENVSPRM
ncbi:MAG: hypothetical protein IAE79_17885 [Anaerolinea sp.]|nr:hypothetical protein [Anaerolinea sp.]